MEEIIASARATLTKVVLKTPMYHPSLFQSLTTCESFKVLEWTEVHKINDEISLSPVRHLITLPYVERLHLTAFSSRELCFLLSIRAPRLVQLRIGSHPEGSFHIETEQLRKFLEGAPRIRELYLLGIFWPCTLDGLPPFRLLHIERLCMTTHTLTSLGGIILSTNQRVNLVVHLMMRHDLVPLKMHKMPTESLACLDTLVIEVRELKDGRRMIGIEGLQEIIPFLDNLRVLRLPSVHGEVSELDNLCQSMLGGAICPKLQEIYSMQYPDWCLFLELIMSRNIPRSIYPDANGPVALKLVAFPRTLHPTIHCAIQDALKGYWVPPLEPWVLPDDM
ncbi:SubName: Full=Uncharacterized protein {ECO:0000313/EMBL:CCA76326.1} [Serendipita indica DSM 11827]|nr:SubName: Full=Uncharacterized protein {ECO:0000313/EMBL:CCA76326.1} [Serendipita indica DSM 11827]